jgi:hypothetical protein
MGNQGQMLAQVHNESGVNEGRAISYRSFGMKATEPSSA